MQTIACQIQISLELSSSLQCLLHWHSNCHTLIPIVVVSKTPPKTRTYQRSTNDPRLGNSSRRRELKRLGLSSIRAGDTDVWAAEVVTAEQCTSEEYKSDQWRTRFEYSHIQKNSCCHLQGTGGLHDLVLTLFTTKEVRYPKPQSIATFRFPTAAAKISLRLYDSRALIEIFTDPVKKKGQRTVGDYWAIFLRGHNDYEKQQATKMLRRLENLPREMPDQWFSYRNFITAIGLATDTELPVPSTVGQYTHEMAGANLTFTGNFARAGFLEALGVRNYRPRLASSP